MEFKKKKHESIVILKIGIRRREFFMEEVRLINVQDWTEAQNRYSQPSI